MIKVKLEIEGDSTKLALWRGEEDHEDDLVVNLTELDNEDGDVLILLKQPEVVAMVQWLISTFDIKVGPTVSLFEGIFGHMSLHERSAAPPTAPE